jgi:drug/metabolite transporter (DMT)-like permease
VFIAGGIIAPILLMMALKLGDAVTVSMLLCLESPITAVFAHFMFREHIGGKDWLALAGTTIACVLLSFNVGLFGLLSSLCATGACVCWALDNNMVSVIDSITASEITFLKGLCAGTFNFVLGLSLAAVTAPPQMFAYAFLFGATCYGVSIYLYIKAAQKIGAGRSQIIFSSAPFWGVAGSALVLHEHISLLQYGAGAIFIASLSLLMRQPHGHVHVHEPLTHTHEHSHDDGHHQHVHEDGIEVADKHTHPHTHDAAEHSHPHWPDIHHRHSH